MSFRRGTRLGTLRAYGVSRPNLIGQSKDAGESFGLRDAGYRAIDSLRLEKHAAYGAGYRPRTNTPLEPGSASAVDFHKAVFVGREASAPMAAGDVAAAAGNLTGRRPECHSHGGRPSTANDRRVGWLTGRSATRSAERSASDMFAIPMVSTRAFSTQGRYELEVGRRKVAASRICAAPYDPDTNDSMKNWGGHASADEGQQGQRGGSHQTAKVNKNNMRKVIPHEGAACAVCGARQAPQDFTERDCHEKKPKKRDRQNTFFPPSMPMPPSRCPLGGGTRRIDLRPFVET